MRNTETYVIYTHKYRAAYQSFLSANKKIFSTDLDKRGIVKCKWQKFEKIIDNLIIYCNMLSVSINL